MSSTKKASENFSPIATRISVMDTFRNIPVGRSFEFSCKDFAPYTSARAAVSRLNDAVGREAYRVTTDDNGATYKVTRFA